ncbi:MAG: hypothetical protein GX892_10305 [Thermoanaerobacteraceae bacterium]|nr:hypothetical protein [Thermoanaerobacteraceae bacterium]
MPYTTCPYCNKRSYSAADMDVWICPYCKKNINEEEREENRRKEQAK